MIINGTVQLGFHKDDELSVVCKQNADIKYEKMFYLLCFASYALRQMLLIKPDSPPGIELLQCFDVLYGRKAIESFVLADSFRCSVVSNQGKSAKKGFNLEIIFDPDSLENYKTTIQPMGFSLFGVGINSHAMNSVFGLLKYLSMIHKEDKEFLSSLAFVAEKIGMHFLIEPGSLSVSKERDFVVTIVNEALRYKEEGV